MGNYVSNAGSDSVGKIVLPDGTVQEFNQPMTAAEIMLEHPQQVVVEFGSLGDRRKLNPLPADRKLEMEKVYLMLPMKQAGKVVSLSAEEAHRILLRSKQVLRSGSFLSSARVLPLLAQMCSAGNGMRHDVVVPRKKLDLHKEAEKADENKHQFQLKLLDERPTFLSIQYSTKDWKPTLDTIKEKNSEKVPHWLFDC